MWTRPLEPVPIHPSQLVPGLFIWLDIPWDAHPFLYNKFRLSSAEQIDKIRALNLTQVLYFPNKSSAQPGPAAAPAMTEAIGVESPVVTAGNVESVEQERLQAEKRERLQRQKDAAARAERGWERSARATREALVGMGRAPKQAGAQIAALSQETAAAISRGEEILLHLLGDKQGEGPQFHAINVMTLSMLLGKAMSLDEATLTDLAMGALAHDIGKARVPAHILKTAKRAKHEETFYREHSAYGAQLARESEAFGTAAIAIIADHHEYLDGKGWPRGVQDTSVPTRIVSLVERYDRLCSPEAAGLPALMPREALAVLYSREAARFDQGLLGRLVRLLGVYPPGTIVQLDDGSLGLVVAPGQDSLRPKVLIYTPELTKDEAPVVDLNEIADVKIEEALRPNSLPADVQAWLSPHQRLSYFFTIEDAK